MEIALDQGTPGNGKSLGLNAIMPAPTETYSGVGSMLARTSQRDRSMNLMEKRVKTSQ
jgi:hypothetical protein